MTITVNTTRRQVVTLTERQVREALVEYLRARGHTLESDPVMRAVVQDPTWGPTRGQVISTVLESVQLTCEVRA